MISATWPRVSAPSGVGSGTGPYRLSEHVFDYRLEDDRYALWNAYFPRLGLVTPGGLDGLRALPRGSDEWPQAVLDDLVSRRILYRGDVDPYEAEFFDTADAYLAFLDTTTDAFYADRVPYGELTFVNSGCNLGCGYCVSYYGDDARLDAAREAVRGDARRLAALDLVDQFIERNRRAGVTKGKFSFNGGEILLRWPIVRAILEHVRERHPDFEPAYDMNTNATLLTKEIADVLADHGVEIHVSIDGYKAAHDQSRVHHGGGESFDQVIAGVQHYRAAGMKLDNFHGTIENLEDFDFDQFFAMHAYGFKSARLAPNLLDHPDPDRGRAAAHWEASLALASRHQPAFGLRASTFHKFLQTTGAETRSLGFRPNCGGLSGTSASRGLVVNIDSMQASHLCSFSSPASVPIGQIRCDIDDRAVWEATRSYLLERMSMLKGVCRGCSVIGLCQGGCVYNALDVHNKLNPAGCAYQRSLWRTAVDYQATGRIRPVDDASEDVHAADAAAAGAPLARGCSSSDLPRPSTVSVSLLASDGSTMVPARRSV